MTPSPRADGTCACLVRDGAVSVAMSALPAGRWSLAAGRTPPQELVFVKLTDSALKALEDYIANQVCCYGQNKLTKEKEDVLRRRKNGDLKMVDA